MRGRLLFGHGARAPEWAKPFHAIRERMVRFEPTVKVELGFLELMRPTFDEGIASLVQQGVTDIVIVPIFMAAGSHVQKDLPRMAGEAMERHAGLMLRIAPPVGEAEPVLAAMAEYALDVKPEIGAA